MTTPDIHSCGPFCERTQCLKDRLARWEDYRAEMIDKEQRFGDIARSFLDCRAWEDAAKCALKADGMQFVIGRMPPAPPAMAPAQQGEQDEQ